MFSNELFRFIPAGVSSCLVLALRSAPLWTSISTTSSCNKMIILVTIVRIIVWLKQTELGFLNRLTFDWTYATQNNYGILKSRKTEDHELSKNPPLLLVFIQFISSEPLPSPTLCTCKLSGLPTLVNCNKSMTLATQMLINMRKPKYNTLLSGMLQPFALLYACPKYQIVSNTLSLKIAFEYIIYKIGLILKIQLLIG